MKQLPNGLVVFNATPHPITFWREDWNDVVVVDSDEVINASPIEKPVSCLQPPYAPDHENVWFVTTEFDSNVAGSETIRRAKEAGADVIVGSIIAAQAYPGDVVAMIPAKGFERVPVPLPKEVIDALNIACQASYDFGHPEYQVQEVYEKYQNLPTKRMSPDKFTVFAAPDGDGLYAVKDGRKVKVDSYTYGYEGMAKPEWSIIIRGENGENELFSGPGLDSFRPEQVVMDLRSEQ